MSRAAQPFISTLDIGGSAVLLVDPIREKDLQLSVDPAPILTPARPFFRDVDHSEIQHF